MDKKGRSETKMWFGTYGNTKVPHLRCRPHIFREPNFSFEMSCFFRRMYVMCCRWPPGRSAHIFHVLVPCDVLCRSASPLEETHSSSQGDDNSVWICEEIHCLRVPTFQGKEQRYDRSSCITQLFDKGKSDDATTTRSQCIYVPVSQVTAVRMQKNVSTNGMSKLNFVKEIHTVAFVSTRCDLNIVPRMVTGRSAFQPSGSVIGPGIGKNC